MITFRNVKSYKKRKILFVIATVILLIGCSRANISSTDKLSVINVSDFGAVPDDGKDDTHAVRAALDEIRKIKNRASLYFSPGKYDFFSDSATTVHYPVTAVHNQWDFVTPFHLDGLEDLTIDGGGSTFIMHGRMTPFVLNACRNVNVTRLSIEHVRPSVFELKVVEKGNSEVEYEAIGNDKFIIENNQLVWLDADDKRQIPNVFQYYDPVKDITRRCPDPLQGANSITKIDSNLIRVQYEPGYASYDKIRSGEFFQFRNGIRNQSGVVVYESQNISFDDMNIYSWNGLGFVSQFCRDLSFKNLRMEPNPESGRTNAGFSDAILMQCPDQRWALQNHVEKLIIRNNVFYECESTLIKSNPQIQELAENAELYGTLEVKDNLVIMREKMPYFLNIRGFSGVNIGTNRIELAEVHERTASFSDCKEVSLSPQMILGVKNTPGAELNRVAKFSEAGW